MAKIISEAGEITLEIKSLRREGNDIIIESSMGIWEAKVYISRGEAIRFVTMALSSLDILLSLLVYPLVLIKKQFVRGG